MPAHSTTLPLQAISAPVKSLWSAKLDTSYEIPEAPNPTGIWHERTFFLASPIQEVIENSRHIGKREVVHDPEARVLREPFACLWNASDGTHCLAHVPITTAPFKLYGCVAVNLSSTWMACLHYWRKHRKFYFLKGLVQYKDGLNWNSNVAEAAGITQWHNMCEKPGFHLSQHHLKNNNPAGTRGI